MDKILQILLVCLSLYFVFFIMKNAQKKKLQYRSMFLWLLLAIITLVLAIFPQIAVKIAWILHIETPSNAVFLVFISLLLIIVFYLNINITNLYKKITILSQENAIIVNKLDSMQMQFKKEIEDENN